MRRAFATALAVVLAAAASGQAAKKVYVSVDMEGISGVSGSDQLSPGGSEYGRSRKLMAEDANAAIRGALAAGATDVVVNDSHGGQRNLLPEDLHPAARLISHSFKRYGMMEGLDESFDAVLFIGYHAKAGSPGGLFAHTGSGVVRDLQINGRSVGEGGMNALLDRVPVLGDLPGWPLPRRGVRADDWIEIFAMFGQPGTQVAATIGWSLATHMSVNVDCLEHQVTA